MNAHQWLRQPLRRPRAGLWVLRLGLGSTLTLKTTDTTLVSVDGDNGRRGALVHRDLPYARPETITEVSVAPSATVTLTQSRGPLMWCQKLNLGRSRQGRTKPWHGSKPFQRCKHHHDSKTHTLVQTLHPKSVQLLESSIPPKLLVRRPEVFFKLERPTIIPF